MKETVKNSILQHGVIAICRGIYGKDLTGLARALYAGGVRHIEVTFDQSDPQCIGKTAEAIAALNSNCPDMFSGAGTVLTVEQAKAAREAGALYIISPNVDESVIRYTSEAGMVSIPGAMTPSEVLSAHNWGADIVKLFPAASLGAKYIKDIRAPISHVKLLATGGISPSNFREFLDVGCCGAGVGGQLCSKALIREKQWDKLTETARAMTDIFNMYMAERK